MEEEAGSYQWAETEIERKLQAKDVTKEHLEFYVTIEEAHGLSTGIGNRIVL